MYDMDNIKNTQMSRLVVSINTLRFKKVLGWIVFLNIQCIWNYKYLEKLDNG